MGGVSIASNRMRKRPSLKKQDAASGGKTVGRTKALGTDELEGEGWGTPVRVLSETFGETPEGLRALERGWREKRRVMMGELEINTPGPTDPRRCVTSTCQTPSNGLYNVGTVERADHPRGRSSKRLPLGQIPLPTPPNSTRSDSPSTPIIVKNKKKTMDEGQCRPIMVGVLPPTHGPVHLTSRSRSTVHVIASPASYSMIFKMEDGSTVKVSRNGRSLLTLSPAKQGHPISRSISLDDSARWKKDERDIWYGIAKLVEGYKRVTAKVKIWHTLGILTVSCSEPPDITLSYDSPARSPPIKGESRTSLTRVRVRYSSLKFSICIDTARSVMHTNGVTEKSRSRREVKMNKEESGYLRCDTSQWTEAEVEAISRFKRLRSEWERYMS